MSSMTLFILFVSVIALLFLFINLIFAPHNPYQEKYSTFECGFHSFLGQNRTQFSIKFFLYALIYLLLDLEILLIYPFAVSEYINNFYGLVIMLIFTIIVTIGFIFELGKGALKIDSRQNLNGLKKAESFNITYVSSMFQKKE
jgi:NADH-ubiquinone oxidoreductase chain 3